MAVTANRRRKDDRPAGHDDPGRVPQGQSADEARGNLEHQRAPGGRGDDEPSGRGHPRRTAQVTTVDRGPGESPGLSLVLCVLSTLTVHCGLLGTRGERRTLAAPEQHQPTTREAQQNRGPTENY